jgi:hypothetical protein
VPSTALKLRSHQAAVRGMPRMSSMKARFGLLVFDREGVVVVAE